MKSLAEKDAAKSRRRHCHKSPVWRCIVREVRDRMGLTMKRVAEGSGVSMGSICKAEHGGGISLETARAIAEYFGMTVAELWPEKVVTPSTSKSRRHR